MADVRYVRVKKFEQLTGYTKTAVYQKISNGVWLEKVHFRRAPDGAILMDLQGYEQWAENQPATV